jgi:lipopolysaccharide/colanic/teichoic acid biosynthesis glycosyltransferase
MEPFSMAALELTRRTPALKIQKWLKHATERGLAVCALLGLAPVFAVLAIAIWRQDGGPIFYSQKRMGLGGKYFNFYKFRSMYSNADHMLEEWKTSDCALFEKYVANNFKLENDPRLLPIGKIIRRSSLDELPQLWNVLCGDMSLIGPRPLLQREIKDYPPATLLQYQQVKPGMSGLWQVNGRSTTTFAKRAQYDSEYVQQWSLWLDLRILCKTVVVVLTGYGAS